MAGARRYRRLDDAEVAAALAGLPGWSGDAQRLRRTAVLPHGRSGRVLAAVHRHEDELDHHAVVEEAAGGTTFVLWTHVRGGVTDADVALARRISAVLDDGAPPGDDGAPPGDDGRRSG